MIVKRHNFKRYGWTRHNGDDYGHQEILDTELGLNLTTQFIRLNDEKWVAKVIGTKYKEPSLKIPKPLNTMLSNPIAFSYYVNLHHDDADRSKISQEDYYINNNDDETVNYITLKHLNYNTTQHSFNLRVKPSKDNKYPSYNPSGFPGQRAYDPSAEYELKQPTFTGKYFKKGQQHLSDEILVKYIGDNLHQQYMEMLHIEDGESDKVYEITTMLGQFDNQIDNHANTYITTHFVDMPFEFEFEWSTIPEASNLADLDIYQDDHDISLPFESIINHRKNEFHEKFDEIFQLKKKGYKSKMRYFAKSALSNLIGGIGYFVGDQKYLFKQKDAMKMIGTSKNQELLTAVPSRSFFPRGFLWDEGFHQLVISKWDIDLSMKIITNWFKKVIRWLDTKRTNFR